MKCTANVFDFDVADHKLTIRAVKFQKEISKPVKNSSVDDKKIIRIDYKKLE